jgi:hypothetical protein
MRAELGVLIDYEVLDSEYRLSGVPFLVYAEHPGLEWQPYEHQMRVRNESLFGVADFYSSNLRKLGHEVWDIHANNEFMQKAWADEHGSRVDSGPRWQFRLRRGLVLWVSRATNLQWVYEIMTAQVKHSE